MNKLIEKALSTKFNLADIPALVELVEQSGNPLVATETLLGVYEQPQINELPHENCDPSYLDKKMISYDKWNDRIQYVAKRNTARGEGAAPVYEEQKSHCSRKQWNTGYW